jgi:DNA-3-methyladenine glycosylase I
MRKHILYPDGIARCPWPGDDLLYISYHDEDWGVPEWDSRALFEKLILDGFQAGLSWITILRKREAFRKAFEGFEPERMARFTPRKVESLMQDAGIVRNRAKIESSITSAKAYLKIEAEQGFANYMWNFVDGRPVQNNLLHMEQAQTSSPLSETISKDLKKRGFNFCGPTIVQAYCQAVGMINDHLIGCHRHAACQGLAIRPAKRR